MTKKERIEELEKELEKLSLFVDKQVGHKQNTIYMNGFPTVDKRIGRLWERFELLEDSLDLMYVAEEKKDVKAHYEKISKKKSCK